MPSGFETSRQAVLFPLETSTIETSKTSLHQTCAAIPNVIFLPVSADGQPRCGSQDGPTTDQYGPAVVLANLSPKQAKAMGLMTSGTYGPPGFGSSSSVDQSASLGNKLRRLTASRGSTLYALTWKVSATPAGRLIFRLRASGLQTSDSGFGGWATPAKRDYRTPNHQTYEERGGGPKGEQLNNQVAHVIPGASLSGSDVRTESLGLLNPEFSRWLQGVPAMWLSFAPSATRSTSESLKKS